MDRKKILLWGFILIAAIIFSRTVNAQEADGEALHKAEFDKIVQKAQEKLNELGYDLGESDGIVGEKTKMAIKKYQQNNGLPKSGELDKRTKRKLGLSDIEDQEVLMIPKAKKK